MGLVLSTNYSEQLLESIQSALLRTFSFHSVNRFTTNLSSFLTGYNWVNQICNHDHARNVTFKDKFHLIQSDSLTVTNKDCTSHVGTRPPQASRKLETSCSQLVGSSL